MVGVRFWQLELRRDVSRGMSNLELTAKDLMSFTNGKKYNTIYADPPWQFQNRTGKVAPEHKRLTRYETMTLSDIKALPVAEIADKKAHLYLWIPNALLPDGLAVMDAWGFEYKGNVVFTGGRYPDLENKFKDLGYESSNNVNSDTIVVIDSSYDHDSTKCKSAKKKGIDIIHVSEVDEVFKELTKNS